MDFIARLGQSRLKRAMPLACGVKDAKNFHLAFSQAIKNDKRCSCDYEFARSIYPARTP